jgi:hypothetical protein
MSSLVLWFTIDHLFEFGPWSALAFFVVLTIPLLVLSHLYRQFYKPAKEEEETMPRPHTSGVEIVLRIGVHTPDVKEFRSIISTKKLM